MMREDLLKMFQFRLPFLVEASSLRCLPHIGYAAMPSSFAHRGRRERQFGPPGGEGH